MGMQQVALDPRLPLGKSAGPCRPSALNWHSTLQMARQYLTLSRDPTCVHERARTLSLTHTNTTIRLGSGVFNSWQGPTPTPSTARPSKIRVLKLSLWDLWPLPVLLSHHFPSICCLPSPPQGAVSVLFLGERRTRTRTKLKPR